MDSTRPSLFYTLPLWLSRGGLTDFVLNAFATVYIVDLDDVTDRETWKLMREIDYFKFRSKTLTGEEDEEAEGLYCRGALGSCLALQRDRP